MSQTVGTPRERITLYHLPSSNNIYEVIFKQLELPIRVTDLASRISTCYQSVQIIEQLSDSKATVTFSKREEANHIVQNRTFTTRFQLFIPRNRAEIAGILDRESLQTSDLLRHGVGLFRDHASNPLPILECTKLPQRDEATRRPQLKVTFPGTSLPDYLELNESRIPIRPHLQRLTWCAKCERFERTGRRRSSSGDPLTSSDVEKIERFRRKTSFSAEVPFNLEQLVTVICEGLRLDPNWKAVLMSLLRKIWAMLIKSAPVLGLLGSV